MNTSHPTSEKTPPDIGAKKHISRLKNIFQWFLIILIAILLAIALRVFIFATFLIPTPSMEPAILPGDKIVVSKLIPGPRIIRNFFSLYKGERPDIKRLKGWRAVRRNDVLIFNFPYSDWNRLEMDMGLFYAKRCVAIPGDTFYIENGIYKVTGSDEQLGCYEKQQQLSAMPGDAFDPGIYHCFPYDEYHPWTIQNFGKLYIPRKDETLQLDMRNIGLYRKLIAYETGKAVHTNEKDVFLNDSLITEYTFLQNYYFMAGDYVFDSRDSRYWGLLPEDHIVGKVSVIWNTRDPATGKKHWKRFLKAVK